MARKIVALVLAMTMVLGLCSTMSFAADKTSEGRRHGQKICHNWAVWREASTKTSKSAKYSKQWNMDEVNVTLCSG